MLIALYLVLRYSIVHEDSPFFVLFNGQELFDRGVCALQLFSVVKI